MHYLYSLSAKITLCVAALLCSFNTELWSQKPADFSSKIHICGVPAKQAEAPARTPSEDIIFDRFGGSYSMTEMEQNATFFTPLDCESSSDFILELDDRNGAFTEAESNVICDVFTYLSSIVDATSEEKAIIRFVKDPTLPTTTAATGSPFFPNECGLGHSLVHRQLTVGRQPQMEHGFIEINPAVNFYYVGNNGSIDIQSNEIDFYTVILHEALHVLGFGSQISTTGVPTQDFYTQWDLGLLAPNGEPLILRSPGGNGACCATYEFNPATNLNLPSDILNQTCGATTTFDVNTSAPIYGEYNGTSNAVFLNTLSHLNNECTPGVSHVMNSAILTGEGGVQRTLSTAEIEIMCKLGFSSPDICNNVEDCITIAGDDGIFYVGLGETIDITFTELLANDITTDQVPTLQDDCSTSNGINVNPFEDNFQITGVERGRFSFCYNVSDCDASCDIATVTVVVISPAIANGCLDSDNCQINPYTDFNIFETKEEMWLALSDENVLLVNGFGNGTSTVLFAPDDAFWRSQSPDFFPGGQENNLSSVGCLPGSIDYEAPDGIGLVRFITAESNTEQVFKEGIVLPLCEPILPGANATITLFAIATPQCVDLDLQLQVDFTEQPPVWGEVFYENPGIVTPSTFHPVNNTFFNGTGNERQTININNTSNSCLNYLYLSAKFIDGITSDDLVFGSVFVGDIEVTINNNLSEVLNLSADPVMVSPPIGQVLEVEVSLENSSACLGNSIDYPASTLNLFLPPGVIHVPTQDFPSTSIFIDENELNPDRLYVLNLRVDDQSLIDQSLVITANMETEDECYNNSITSTISILSPTCPLPTPNFTSEIVADECGVFNYFSSSSSDDDIHKWYLNEQTDNALFSMEANPSNHMLPDGSNTIIHVVEGSCGPPQVFELNLPFVNCNNPLFTCPCTGGNSINLEAGLSKNLSQFINEGVLPSNGIDGKCLAINGHLTIDAASVGTSGFYEILNSEVRMQPGSSITIKAGGALRVIVGSNRGIHGCESLWKGISLESAPDGSNGGRLYLYGAIIEDAVHAVKLGDNSIFEMLYSTLNRNYIGIYMPPSSNSQYQKVFQPTFPHLSAITTTDELLPHYLGQSQNFENSYACVELNDCSNFQVGGGNLFGLIMSDANYGVVAKNSAHVVSGVKAIA